MAELKDGRVANHLNKLTDKLKKEVYEISTDLHLNLRIDGLGGEFTFYFTDHEVTNFREAISTDNGNGERFLKLQKQLQDKGIRLLPRHIYHHGFSYFHTEKDIDDLTLAIRETLPHLDK
jgi:glutamate-1-semialdehyde 2,1-aminomutase